MLHRNTKDPTAKIAETAEFLRIRENYLGLDQYLIIVFNRASGFLCALRGLCG
jgi:hypothetical protein